MSSSSSTSPTRPGFSMVEPIGVDTNAAIQPEGAITGLIFDIDNTFKNTFDLWYRRSQRAIDRYAESRANARGQDPAEVRAEIMEQLPAVKAYRWFNNVDVVAKEVPVLQARPGENFEAIDAAIAHEYQRAKRDDVEMFPGTLESFARLKERGATLFVQTDAEKADVKRTLWKMQIPPDTFFLIASKPDLHATASVPYPMNLEPGEAEYYAILEPRMIEATAKPNPAVVQRFSIESGIPLGAMAMVGDNLSDARNAREAGIAHVWQKQGAAVAPATEAFQHHVSGDHYRIGLQPTILQMQDKGVWPPAFTLENGMADLERLPLPKPPQPKVQPAATEAAPRRALGR